MLLLHDSVCTSIFGRLRSQISVVAFFLSRQIKCNESFCFLPWAPLACSGLELVYLLSSAGVLFPILLKTIPQPTSCLRPVSYSCVSYLLFTKSLRNPYSPKGNTFFWLRGNQIYSVRASLTLLYQENNFNLNRESNPSQKSIHGATGAVAKKF